ncbi:unnamed protein product [Musa acuminata subsp. malaccensis]|uniref:(wild Malaysian banana) hypothetical protein n=1 Tax=Musa acuminata subsp. malaccensis TaxID=214687 RepID=A0A8D7B7D6_MUSAM|nr:PREDICTED: ethylene-responsive transcription factor 1-like [Musa acuminata subsp. malaccensis]CAG1862953.1 unnamed protein product [Musa acuminata subsp. malaccensis]
MEDRELTKPDYSDSLITIPAAPSEVTGLNFHSEQGSNSFGYTDIGWELEAKMPDITSILAPTITEGDEPESFDDISLWKKVEPNNLKRQCQQRKMLQPNSQRSYLLTKYKPYMKFLPEPYFEGSLDASIDSLFGGELVQDDVDLWSFDDLPTRASCTEGF